MTPAADTLETLLAAVVLNWWCWEEHEPQTRPPVQMLQALYGRLATAAHAQQPLSLTPTQGVALLQVLNAAQLAGAPLLALHGFQGKLAPARIEGARLALTPRTWDLAELLREVGAA
ncbi:hypothetical protein K7W42_20435 [Deinococcus sp. HMF7604]|uniref:hypothetical protein n=1 Tax=Deinococcus betulae TaxID=2873312 RepID=UPI001CCD1977|nr:hypothetical protein [Deinococcus betulae]MBZ9753208.1 hypothetical protein [Deinococcus betulae]